jgi:hypothetical protein
VVIRVRRAEVAGEVDTMSRHPERARIAARQLAADHSLTLMDAEIAWTDRAIRRIGGNGHAAVPDPAAMATARHRRKIAV